MTPRRTADSLPGMTSPEPRTSPSVAIPAAADLPAVVRALHSPRVFPIASGVCVAIGLGFTIQLKTPTGLLIGAYALSVFYVLRLGVLAAARRFLAGCSNLSLDAPIAGRFVLRTRAAWVVPLAVFALLTAIRENAIGSGPVFDVSFRHIDTNHRWNTTSSYNWQTSDAPRTMLGALTVRCIKQTAAGSHADDIVDGFNGFIACDTPATRADAARGVTVTFELQTHDAWCYAPLFKTATIPYTLNIQVSATVREGTGVFEGNGHLAIAGQVTQTVYGLASCRAFNNAVGRQIGVDSVGVLNAFLRAN